MNEAQLQVLSDIVKNETTENANTAERIGTLTESIIQNMGLSSDYRLVACVIRNSGSGWDKIEGNGHESINVDSVSNGTTTVVVDFASLGVTQVGSLLVVPDETYAGEYEVGASVSLTSATISIFKRQIIQDAAALITHSGNGVFTSTNANITPTYNTGTGVLTLTHTTATTNNTPTYHSLQSNDAGRLVLWNSTNSINGFATTYKLYDADGTTQKSLTDPDMTRFYYNRSNGETERVLQDPNDVDDATGNFWIFGIFKIA